MQSSRLEPRSGVACQQAIIVIKFLENECPAGYRCPEGSADPKPCPVGSFTNETLQSECRPCDAGSYCNGTGIQVNIMRSFNNETIQNAANVLAKRM